jgi:hypothetical protein
MQPKFYSSYYSLKLAILLAMVIAPQTVAAQDPTVEQLDNGSVLITYPNGTYYTNVDHAGDSVGSSVWSKGEGWTDCRKNEAKCREELEEAEDGNKSDGDNGKGKGKGKGKKKKKRSTQSGAAGQNPSSVRDIKELSVEALLKLPGTKQVTKMSKKEFMTKYGPSMNRANRR